MKGAPERILDRCTHIMINGENIEMNEEWRAKFTHAYETLGGMGERVLGFAHLYQDAEQFPKGFAFETEPPNFPSGDLENGDYFSIFFYEKKSRISTKKNCYRVFRLIGNPSNRKQWPKIG